MNALYEFYEQLNPQKLIRLVMIVGGYVLLRKLMLNHIKKRQVQTQIDQDNKDKAEAALRKLEGEDPNNVVEEAETTGVETGFGWGKRTRKGVKDAEARIKKQAELLAQSAANAGDSDDEIADLLEE